MTEICYMTRPEELKKHQRLVAINGGDQCQSSLDVIKEYFEGHDDALKMAVAFWNFEHVLDDVIDESGCSDEVKSKCLFHVEQWASTLLITAQKYSAKRPDIYEIVGAKPFEGQRGRLAEQAIKDFERNLWDNPFSNRYRFELRAMFVMALMRCVAGDSMKAKNHPLATAVACADVDVLLHMVFLSRGWDAANRFSVIRQYDVSDGVLEGAT